MNILMATADHLMIDRRIIQEARSLIQAGHRVTLLAGFECPERASYTEDGIRIERFVYDWSDSRFQLLSRRFGLTPGTRIYRFSWSVFRVWAKLFGRLSSFEQFIFDRMTEYQVDLIHAHDFPMLSPSLELAGLRKVPLIYDAHELYYAQVQLPLRVRSQYKRKEARLIKHCTRVITVNPFIARLMAERYSVSEPNVILNASELKPLAQTRVIRDRFALADDTKIVIYQGWISANRGIERLVEAAAEFSPNIVLVVVGYGDFETELKKIASRKKLTDKVLFFGGVPSDQLHEITCDADLGVIPYHGVDENNYFCSPNKLFEFAVAALPFLCNDLPFLRQIAEQFGSGIISDLNSPSEIARAVNRVFGDERLLADARSGALRAREALNWTQEEKVLLNIYDDVSKGMIG